MMLPKVLFALKITAVILLAICVVIFFSVNKYTTSIALTITAIVILLPFKTKGLKIGRVVFIAIILAMSLWNISTVDLPKDHYETGVLFFDKVIHIFQGFLENTFGTRLNLG